VETASFESAAEGVLEGLAPAPNCPAMKTWAALASFDLIFGAAAGWAGVDPAADVELAAKALPATVCALPELLRWTLTEKLPEQGGAP
jgi:hypothetical protein